ncbi:MFS transporter [Aldersonia kunmingensis]|uniref:MFS transporter n=1 Tax=Aldersonia kunmingensis TaxID=408066 RepID=UPI000829A3C7|nr:MFS transporter [Aldersonia kunmingensis]
MYDQGVSPAAEVAKADTSEGMSKDARRTLVASTLGVSLVIGTTVALNSALADIAVQTSATQSQLTWIVDSYTVVLAGAVLPAGALGDRFGRRGALILGLAIFMAASLAPVAISSPEQLIVARAIAGLGAALVMPATLSLITTAFPPEKRARAIGIWSGVGGSSSIVVLLGSGVLLEYWGWQSIFWALSAIGLVTFVVSCTISTSRDPNSTPIDVPGSILICASVALLVLGVVEAPLKGWTDPFVYSTIAAGLAGGALFGVLELRRRYPLLDVRLFRNATFTSAVIAVTALSFSTFGLFYLIVQYIQMVLGYSPLLAGLALGPQIFPIAVLGVISPLMVPRFGLRLLLGTGLALQAVGFATLMTLEMDSTYLESVWPQLIIAVGLGLTMTPATAAIMASVSDDKQGVASAVNDSTREIGAALGIAVAGSLLAARYAGAVTPKLAEFPEQVREPAASSLAAAMHIAPQIGPLGEQLEVLAKSGFMEAMNASAIGMCVILAVAAVIVALCGPGRDGRVLIRIGRKQDQARSSDTG